MAALRRVVVTGLGAVTPLGASVEATWARLLRGETGVVDLRASHPELAELPCTVGAPVDRGTFDAAAAAKRSPSPRAASPFVSFALAAAAEALADAGWSPRDRGDTTAQERTGVAIGSGIGSISDIDAAARLVAERGHRKLSPNFVPRILANSAAGHVSMAHGFYGPNHSVSTACATGAHAIGDAYRMVERGDADVMVAGGAEASIDPLSFAGFSRLRALCTDRNENPAAASRPFDEARSGFVMGEGAGVVVVEALDHAVARGVARIYGELRGYGMSGDGHHVTAPEQSGRGAKLCMRAALRRSGLTLNDVAYVNAHATSTPLGDAIEAAAICAVFTGEEAPARGDPLRISSTKGGLGHMLGAAGAVEAIITLLALRDGVAPPTLNLEEPLPLPLPDGREGAALLVGGVPQFLASDATAAMSNSFGFGGTNTSLLFSRFDGGDGQE